MQWRGKKQMNGTALPRTDAVLSEQPVRQGLSEDISYVV